MVCAVIFYSNYGCTGDQSQHHTHYNMTLYTQTYQSESLNLADVLSRGDCGMPAPAGLQGEYWPLFELVNVFI
jgi:hypothetical protein